MFKGVLEKCIMLNTGLPQSQKSYEIQIKKTKVKKSQEKLGFLKKKNSENLI